MGREFEVEGTVTPGYESVRDRFARNWEDFDEVGAAYALYVDGEKVVDIWSGTLDRDTDEPYVADTLQLVFSATKGATAACAALLADRGELDVDLPVAHYWPEFAQAGKERIPVRYLLSHKAGLPTFEGALTAEEMLAWDPVIRRLEESAPVWEPGARHGYHAITYGYLVGEVVRRISGKSLGTFFRNEFAEPLGLEFWIGLPEEHFSRVAPLVDQFGSETAGDPEAAAEMSKMMSETLLGRALKMNGAMNGLDGGINAPAAWSAEIPAANGVTNARSLARLYASLIGGVQDGPSEPLISRVQIDKARTRQTEGLDAVLAIPGLLEVETPFALGFWVNGGTSPFGGASGSFGHPGAGGSLGYGDPDRGIAGGYVMNRMSQGVAGDSRSVGLIEASYKAAGRSLN